MIQMRQRALSNLCEWHLNPPPDPDPDPGIKNKNKNKITNPPQRSPLRVPMNHSRVRL